MLPSSSILTVRPDSETEISQIADRLLRRAGAMGVLPTPLDSIIDTARIIDVIPLEECNEEFLASLRESARGTFRSIMQKVRGVADLRKDSYTFSRLIALPESVLSNYTNWGISKFHGTRWILRTSTMT